MEATYELQLEVEHTIPDFHLNIICAMHITSQNFCTKKFRKAQESGENC